MRRNLLTIMTLVGMIAALTLACQAAYYSHLKVKDVLIRTDGDNINLRVVVHESTGASLHNQPFEVRLLVRHDDRDSFRVLKNWNEKNLRAGQELALDYFAAAGPDDPALHENHYEVRGEVWAGGTLVSSKDASN